jgi:hypothetical protein
MTENERKGVEQNENIFNTWIESYTAISRMWEESYLKLYKPWLESTGELFEKAIDAASSNSPEKYREFYEEWTKTFQGKVDLRQIPTAETNKEILGKFLIGAEKSTVIYKNWITELDENSRLTRDALKGETDPIKYKEIYDLWIKSYAKIFDELLTLPFRDNIREMFEKYTGIPDIYSDTFVKISKLWNESYTKLYGSWMEAILELSKKSDEISKGKATPESYKEFYNLWADVYQKTYGKLINIKSVQESAESKEQLKSTFETFAQSTQVYTDLYKSWMTTLEKLSIKSKELAKQPSSQDVHKETFNLWIRLYQKVFDSFFDNMRTISPFKEFLVPIKGTAGIYLDNLNKMSDFWLQSYKTVYRT